MVGRKACDALVVYEEVASILRARRCNGEGDGLVEVSVLVVEVEDLTRFG